MVAGVERGEEETSFTWGFPSQHTCMHVRERGGKRKERKRGEREKKITSEEERGE